MKRDLLFTCGCEPECTQKLSLHMVQRWRLKYYKLPQGLLQRQTLLDLYRESIHQGSKSHYHNVEGTTVCGLVWYKVVMKISRRTYFRTQRAYQTGLQYYADVPQNMRKSERGQIALGYMSWYVTSMGDQSPESERILLPLGITVSDIYQRYTLATNDDDIIRKSQFYSIWKVHFKHVSQPKHCKMSKCNVCMMAKVLLEKTCTPGMREIIMKDRDEHLSRQQKERVAYYTRRAEAVCNQAEKMSLIADAMDQSKTNLPHFRGWSVPKFLDNAHLLQTHIVGVLIHGMGMQAFIDLLQWPHDSNLTLNCVLQSLQHHARNGCLPQSLYVQLDNCGHENKNKFFLGMMAYLVQKGYVKEVLLSFLMVGHTHEDIDQRFSKISHALRRKSAMTVPELVTVVQESLSSGVTCQLITQVYNIRDWLSPCLAEIHNHTFPHVYRIFGDKPGHVAINNKNWSEDEEWLPGPNDPTLEIFSLDSMGQQILPVGLPVLVPPEYDRKNDINKLKENVAKINDFLSSTQRQWWESFLTDPHSICRRQERWYLSVLRPLDNLESPDRLFPQPITSPLSLLLRKERALPAKVYTGRRPQVLPSCTTTEAKQSTTLMPDVGFMVGFHVDDSVNIGKVIEIGQDHITATIYRGTLNGTWKAICRPDGGERSLEIPNENVIDNSVFILSKWNKMPDYAKEKLRKFLS